MKDSFTRSRTRVKNNPKSFFSSLQTFSTISNQTRKIQPRNVQFLKFPRNCFSFDKNQKKNKIIISTTLGIIARKRKDFTVRLYDYVKRMSMSSKLLQRDVDETTKKICLESLLRQWRRIEMNFNINVHGAIIWNAEASGAGPVHPNSLRSLGSRFRLSDVISPSHPPPKVNTRPLSVTLTIKARGNVWRAERCLRERRSD